MSEEQQAQQVKPNGAPPAEAKAKNLVQKLAEVMTAVGYTQKRGWNEAQKYHYVTEADIVEKIRPELAKRNVIIFPSLVKNERTKLERFNMKGEVRMSYATDVVMRWTIVDGDSGEQQVCEIPGCSESPGDKGVYVAITGSEKYLLKNLLLLPTGDDPEDDSNEPSGSKEAAKAVGKRKVKELEQKLKASVEVAEAKRNGERALFYVWDDESQRAEITGDYELKQTCIDLLRPLGDRHARTYYANAEQLENLKYSLEQRKVTFKALKSATK